MSLVNEICVKICEMPLVLFFTGSSDKVRNNLILGIILISKSSLVPRGNHLERNILFFLTCINRVHYFHAVVMANSALKSSPTKLFFAIGKEKEKYIVSSLAFSKTFKPLASICFLNHVI